jgi:hypothetical protein
MCAKCQKYQKLVTLIILLSDLCNLTTQANVNWPDEPLLEHWNEKLERMTKTERTDYLMVMALKDPQELAIFESAQDIEGLTAFIDNVMRIDGKYHSNFFVTPSNN